MRNFLIKFSIFSVDSQLMHFCRTMNIILMKAFYVHDFKMFSRRRSLITIFEEEKLDIAKENFWRQHLHCLLFIKLWEWITLNNICISGCMHNNMNIFSYNFLTLKITASCSFGKMRLNQNCNIKIIWGLNCCSDFL